MGYIAGMSGDKDLQIKALLNSRESYRAALEEIKSIALTAHPSKLTEDIVAICDKFLDQRSDNQRLKDRVAELEARLASLEEESA